MSSPTSSPAARATPPATPEQGRSPSLAARRGQATPPSPLLLATPFSPTLGGCPAFGPLNPPRRRSSVKATAQSGIAAGACVKRRASMAQLGGSGGGAGGIGGGVRGSGVGWGEWKGFGEGGSLNGEESGQRAGVKQLGRKNSLLRRGSVVPPPPASTTGSETAEAGVLA